jgi:PAS domain S-box-containing protein
LTAAETVLLAITIFVFILGTLFNLAEPATSVTESGQLDELLLALPLLPLVLALVLRRRTQAWRQQEARYHTLVEQLPAVVYVLAADEQATRLYFSSYSTTLTGYTPEEALAQADHWRDWIHLADRKRVLALDAETNATGAPFRAEYRHLRKDGSYVWVLDECVPVRDATGTVIAWQGVVLDITTRVEAEEARTRLAAIVDSAEDALSVAVSRPL